MSDRLYAETALEREAASVASAASGGRNMQLNSSAFSLGQLVGAELLDRSTVEQRLQAAARAAGMDRSEISETIKSGLNDGSAQPRRPDSSSVPNGNGGDPAPAAGELDEDGRRRIERARRIVEEARPPWDTLAETYLVHERGIPSDAIGAALFHPAERRKTEAGDFAEGPAVVIPAQRPDGTVTACQSIFLDKRGRAIRDSANNKVKRTRGLLKGTGAVFTARDGGGPTVAADGPEDALSLAAARPGACAVATLGIAGIRNLRSRHGRLLWFADNGASDEEWRQAQRRLAELLAGGLQVYVARPPEGVKDANDVLRDHGADALSDLVRKPEPLDDGLSLRKDNSTEDPGARSPVRPQDDRPDITVAGGALPEIVDAAEAEMLDRGPPIFQRGALLVRVVRTVGGDSAGVRREAGTPVIRQVDATWLREQLTRFARFRKWDARMEDYKNVDCPKEVSETLLARCGTWRARPLRTIVQAPTPRPDGSVIEREGYDDETALLFDANGVRFPSVPDRPSKADAVTALNRLLRPLEEFPFANRQDETVALSAVLTALARPSLRTAPMHVFSAPAAGSGKSMLADYAALVSTGRPASVVTHGRTDEEAEKRIGAVLLQGDQVVNLDNVERPLSGELLCQLLTQETIKVRKLGVSEMIDAPSVATFLATGNNLTITGDLVRRVVMCALDPEDERPEHRRFSRDFYAYVRENRGQLVADALTVLKAFKVAGCPDQNLQPLGGFSDWSAWIRNALVWLDMTDPCLTTERLRETDPNVGNLRAVVNAWLETFGENPTTARQAIDRATFTVNGQLTNESLHEALSAVAGDKGGINARRLGNWLRKHDGRVIDGFRIERGGDDGHGIVCWKATRARSEGNSHPGFMVSPGLPQYPVGNCQDNDSDSDSDSFPGGGETDPEGPGNPEVKEGSR